MQRRDFLGVMAGTAAASATSMTRAGGQPIQTPTALERPKETIRGYMRYRQLGKTGQEVSLLGLGGFHIGKQKEEKDSIEIIRTAIDAGITFMDNSWDYNDGASEIRMGKALLDGYRKKVFLMTKIDGRTKQSAADQIDQSLKRLQTDVLDLLQFHEIIRMEDPDRIFAKGGAMEAVRDAKKAGKIRFIGFTGHKDPLVHLRMMEVAIEHDFRFDTVQMPQNVMDVHFRSFTRKVLPVAIQNGIGVLGMKPMGNGEILKSKTVTAIECLHFAMNLPISVVITGIDSLDILKQGMDAVKSFKELTVKEEAALLAKTEKAAAQGEYERFKTTNAFDSTAKNPAWLGEPDKGPG
jgi:predicted aldo/keto reductase-like oxidoreductase